jgi:hypothetical protein
MPQMQDYLISAKKKIKTRVHTNFTTSTHSSQYDFKMYGLTLGPFNFHKIKEKSKHPLQCI